MTQAGEAWLVLGASSAIARAFARAAASDGAEVILAGRDRDDLERTASDIGVRFARRASVLDFDATDHAARADVIARAREIAGGATLNIMLAFGVMPPQEAIDADPALALRVIDANFASAVAVLQLAAPVLEAQGNGRVVALGSVAGDRGRLKNYVYGAAKAGFATYLQGLRARLFRAGVSVTTVKPGFVDTAMTFGLPGLFLVATPEDVARACLAAAKRGREELYVPFFWRGIMMIIRNIPERLFKRLNI
jgi:short-subunit dehydrogenase